ncbi:putative membrane protein YesL [Sanguibacter antarcticus]|uniref:Putative membrane protein YesL n=1 Tax=Sanguibacter antarcticus TaxID=372484 RepID=A0A2A9E2C8_9MICO|nr:putative membrane protein YesL [Sanguibacter antarcticus]
MNVTERRAPGTGWEQTALRILTYPANLALAGAAGFILALPVVTAVPAVLAVARSLDGWMREDSTTVFTSTFREFAATWRRTLPFGILSVVVVGLLAFDAWFLWAQVASGTSGLAIAVGGASIPVAVSVVVILLVLPVAVCRNRDGTMKQWLAEAGFLAITHPVQTTVQLILAAVVLATLGLVPSMLPFFGISLPVYLVLSGFAGSAPPSSRSASGTPGDAA